MKIKIDRTVLLKYLLLLSTSIAAVNEGGLPPANEQCLMDGRNATIPKMFEDRLEDAFCRLDAYSKCTRAEILNGEIKPSQNI